VNPAVSFAIAVCALILYFGRRSRRQYLQLPEIPPDGARAPEGRVTAIIPARNEESVIARCVRSLAPSVSVIVVDDHSGDRTAEEARAAGATVAAAPPLPEGWLGKPHACWTGARKAETEWLLFVDADTWYEPGFVAALLSFAESRGLDAVSVFPRQVCQRWFESALVEYGLGLYFAGVDAARLNDPASPEALANGQCILVRREEYFRLGGHQAVASSVTEDVALAVLFKRHGLPFAVCRAEHLARVRMYDSFLSLWRGFQKNSFRVLFHNPRCGLLIILATIAMTSWLPASALLAWAGWRAAALLPPAAAILAWKPWYGSWRRALWAPLAIYLFQGIVVSAMFASITGRGAVWKGRRV
jgi:cellulose synthase/poly-beta-1,6-N-acetylglucosamine synthase-like glycosyltransferase